MQTGSLSCACVTAGTAWCVSPLCAVTAPWPARAANGRVRVRKRGGGLELGGGGGVTAAARTRGPRGRPAGSPAGRRGAGISKVSVAEDQAKQSKESVTSEKEEREKGERVGGREKERGRERDSLTQSERLVTKTQTSKQAGRGRGGETGRQRHEVREGRDRDRAGDRNRQTERFRNRQTRESGFSEADESPQPLFLPNRFPTPP